jgi:7-keto-8-aminopelargonate synthetase-like enzyme
VREPKLADTARRADVTTPTGRSALRGELSSGQGFGGRHVEVGGRALLNFASYDYLGLSRRAELTRGALEATRRYGPQFPFPSAMLRSELYLELEERLRSMTGGQVVVTPSTTLGHLAALPALVDANDAVLVDIDAHPSLHTALAAARVETELIDSGDLELVEDKLRARSARRRVWLVLDGLQALTGRFAPIDELAALATRYPALHLYVDEAHATTWTGTHGRGHALDRVLDPSRVVVTLSLNKAFSAAGAALVLADQALVLRITLGRGMAFSGAIPPPMLGAAIASAELNLSAELVVLQRELLERLELVVVRARALGVPLVDTTRSPLFFVCLGSSDETRSRAGLLRDEGIYVTPVAAPMVPEERSGIRFTVSIWNQPDDIERLLRTLARAR